MFRRRLLSVLLGTVSTLAWGAASHAADLMLSPIPVAEDDYPLNAVSAINGKWEFDAGAMSPGNATFRAAGVLSIPIGERFGLQADLIASMRNGSLAYSGVVHAFTRDPSLYLAGITAGVLFAPGSRLAAVGPEFELYLDRLSIEGWFGYAGIDYVDPLTPDTTGAFAFGEVAYYPTDDWRLDLGGSSVLGENSLTLGTEYLLRDFGTPLSLVADARAHTNGNYTFTIGLKGYIGGNDDNKSLIDRHRQDDPGTEDLFAAAGDSLGKKPPATAPVDPEQACLDGGGYWYYDSGLETMTCGYDD
jgi:hypothetical protein